MYHNYAILWDAHQLNLEINFRLQYKNVYTPKFKKVNRIPNVCEFNQAEKTASMKCKAVTNCSKNLRQSALSSLGHSARLAARCRRAHIEWEPGQGVRAVRSCTCVCLWVCVHAYMYTTDIHKDTHTLHYNWTHVYTLSESPVKGYALYVCAWLKLHTHTQTNTYTYTLEHILIHLCIIDVHNWVRAWSGGTCCTKLYMCVFLCTFVYRYT